jgi:3',5'-cyclic-nucleotide phosphodiesterase
MPTNKNHFELIILGCSGGPISGKTCSFLLKPTDVDSTSYLSGEQCDDLLAIDAGTGLTSIFKIVNNKENNTIDNFKSSFLVELYPKYNTDCESIQQSINEFTNTSNMSIKLPFEEIHDMENLNLTNYQIADKLLNSVNGYLITHPHLDHVSSLIINSPAFKKQKTVYGLSCTTDSIKNNLFNDVVWPDLVSMDIVKLNPLQPNIRYSDLSKRYSVTPFKISHGKHSQDNSTYFSTAFLINDRKNDYNIIFFGDVESDLSSGTQLNLSIWKKLSSLLIEDKLSSIVIECSTPDIPPPLFGHMIPTHLIYEFLTLRKECIDLKYLEYKIQNLNYDNDIYKNFKYQPLSGLNVIIIHVKETLNNVNPRKVILKRLNELNEKHNLQINFTIALSGISLIL